MAGSSSQTPDREERIQELMEYFDEWEATREKYEAWIRTEYARRLREFNALRRQERKALIRGVKKLKFDERGRLTDSKGGWRAKQSFKTARDRILIAVVMKAKEIFGFTGKPNAAGVFVGQIDKKLRKQITEQLRGVMDADS